MTPERPNRPLKSLLYERRTELGLSQKEAAEIIDVHPGHYSRWEHGDTETPRVPHRPGIAKFLEMELGDVNALLDGSDVDETEERIRNLVQNLVREMLDERR